MINNLGYNSAIEIIKEFNSNKLYFDQEEYSCLISPCMINIDKHTSDRLRKDVSSIWEWLNITIKIYSEALLNNIDFPIINHFEWGLDQKSIMYQRESANNGDIPHLCRLDSVLLNPFQQIAEVQWKGGGEGFINEIICTYSKLFNENIYGSQLGDFVEGLSKIIRSSCKNTKNESEILNILNTGRTQWMQAEKYLSRRLLDYNINLISLIPNEVEKKISIKSNHVYIDVNGKSMKLDYIYLDRLSEAISEPKLCQIIESYNIGNIVIDPPPSYLFNQKISLALPFIDEFKSLFSEDIKKILIPTVLVASNKINLKPLITSFTDKYSSVLYNISCFDQLIDLPKRLRENLVIKCASSHRYDNHGGHGVFRLWGSQSVVRKLLNNISQRVFAGEPWIIQPYINETWNVPLCHPNNTVVVQQQVCHARYGIYCGRMSQKSFDIIGAIATFSPFWKVAGKTAAIDSNGKLTGSAFTDIRISIEG